jgi:hypothetical protein
VIRRNLAALAVALITVAVATACGGDDESGSETSASKGSSAVSELLGTYERTVTKADLARTADRVIEEQGFERTPPGPQRLVIEDGSFTVTELRENFPISQKVAVSDEGNFDVGDYIRPDEGAFCGPGVPQGAIYSWRLEDDVLTLKAESDSCADRDTVLSGEWKRTEEQ